jgi:hypothetical protein
MERACAPKRFSAQARIKSDLGGFTQIKQHLKMGEIRENPLNPRSIEAKIDPRHCGINKVFEYQPVIPCDAAFYLTMGNTLCYKTPSQ